MILNGFAVWQWAVLACLPPLILLLYFLKLRRVPLEVPSTYLWMRTVEDMHVNSIWQRLRNNLLLWLQLLLVLLLLLSGLRPGCEGEKLVGARFIFLVDNSASMGATDRGDTRLELAKQDVASLIDRMKPNDQAMLMSFANGVDVLQSYTSDTRLLKRKLERIKLTQRPTEISEALIAASGLANPGRTSDRESNRDYQVAEAREAKLYIVSDGGMQGFMDISLAGLSPEYHPIGGVETPDNLGIVAFAITSKGDGDQGYQAFARVENFGETDVETAISLYVNGELFDTQGGMEIKATQALGLTFELASVAEQFSLPVDVRMEIDRPDDLAIDNVAHGVLSRPEQSQVLVISDYNRYLEMGMLTERIRKLASIEFKSASFMDSKDYENLALSGYYDLIVYDRCQPTEMPRCNTFFIGALPPGDRWQQQAPFSPVAILDFARNHPVTQYAELARLLIIEASVLSGPPASEPLIESPEGPIMMIGPREGFQDLVMSFAIVGNSMSNDELNTDWPNHLSFPLVMQNIVTYLGGVSDAEVSENVRTGELATLRLRETLDEVVVTRPDGVKNRIERNKNNQFIFSATEDCGIYEVRPAGETELEDMFPVNLMQREESDIRVREKLELGYEVVEGSETSQSVRWEYWKLLVLGAVVVLAVEWIIYNRRMLI